MTATSKGQNGFWIVVLWDEMIQNLIPDAGSRGALQASKVDHIDVLDENKEKSGTVKRV